MRWPNKKGRKKSSEKLSKMVDKGNECSGDERKCNNKLKEQMEMQGECERSINTKHVWKWGCLDWLSRVVCIQCSKKKNFGLGVSLRVLKFHLVIQASLLRSTKSFVCFEQTETLFRSSSLGVSESWITVQWFELTSYWSEISHFFWRLVSGVGGSHEARVNGARLHFTPAEPFPLVSTDKYMTSQTSGGAPQLIFASWN